MKLINSIKRSIFGVRAESQGTASILKNHKTTCCKEQPNFNQWASQLNVSNMF